MPELRFAMGHNPNATQGWPSIKLDGSGGKRCRERFPHAQGLAGNRRPLPQAGGVFPCVRADTAHHALGQHLATASSLPHF